MKIQWGSEYRQPFEYQKHLNTKLFEVWILNGSGFKWSMGYVLYTRLTIQILDQYKRIQDGIHLSGNQNSWAIRYSKGIQKPEHLPSNLFLTI